MYRHAHLKKSRAFVNVIVDIRLAITVRRKFLTGENINEFDEFPAIRQYFPHQNFPFS